MFKIYKMNSLPTTGLEEGNIYYVINPNNTDSMDVYVVDNTLQLNKISTTNGTEISFDDSSTIDEEITNIYDEHTWADFTTLITFLPGNRDEKSPRAKGAGALRKTHYFIWR